MAAGKFRRHRASSEGTSQHDAAVWRQKLPLPSIATVGCKPSEQQAAVLAGRQVWWQGSGEACWRVQGDEEIDQPRFSQWEASKPPGAGWPITSAFSVACHSKVLIPLALKAAQTVWLPGTLETLQSIVGEQSSLACSIELSAVRTAGVEHSHSAAAVGMFAASLPTHC